jgi:hypothetical protein
MKVASTGAFARFETTALLSAAEAETAMHGARRRWASLLNEHPASMMSHASRLRHPSFRGMEGDLRPELRAQAAAGH